MSLPDFLRRPAPRRLVTLACGGYWLFAAAASHVPAKHVPDLEVSDKVLHGGGYFVLASLFWLVLAAHRLARPMRVLLVLSIIPLYGVLDEWTQPLVNRTCDVWDWVADTVAAVAAVALWESLTRARRWVFAGR